MLSTTRVLKVCWTATHVVVRLPRFHPEANMHGHSWEAELHVCGAGEDFAARDLDAAERGAAEWAEQTLDHQHLNEVMANSTSEEAVAQWLFEQWAPRLEGLALVRVSARPGEWTAFTPDSGQ
jgi:6-pyruvoyltetrahydropterin/6-carboxytetrahydropterin synthase